MQNKTKKIIWASVVVLAIISAGSAAIYILKANAVPPPGNTDEAAKFIASKKFRSLPLEKRQEYLRKSGRQSFRSMRNMDEKTRRNFRSNMRSMRMAEMNQRLDRFFKMSEAEQNAQLDKDIAEMQKRMEEFARRRQQQQQQRNGAQPGGGNNADNPPPPPGEGVRRQGPSAQMRRERDAAMNPATRAKMQVYMEKLRQRAAATGKTMPGPPRR